MNLVREPDAVNRPVRFDEREVETEQWYADIETRTGKPRHGIMPKPNPPRHLSILPFSCANPHRPGRYEARVRKRRAKNYQLMNKPRKVSKKALAV
jgi:hypothetical protein